MPNSIDPTKARLVRDVKNYRRKVAGNSANPAVQADVIHHLKHKDPLKYANLVAGQLGDLNVYGDFASFPEKPGTGANQKKVPGYDDITGRPKDDSIVMLNRLGGGLPTDPPTDLAVLPPPSAGQSLTWNKKNDHGPGTTPVTVRINAQGAVIHTDPVTGNELPHAHTYMHGIFDTILYQTRDLLDDINKALEGYAAVVSDTNTALNEAGTYLNAVTAFNDYCDRLQPNGGSPFANAFTFVGISPVVTNEGFIVSCRVKLNWKNPYHSSSTIKIP
jgi:hypothetical protein